MSPWDACGVALYRQEVHAQKERQMSELASLHDNCDKVCYEACSGTIVRTSAHWCFGGFFDVKAPYLHVAPKKRLPILMYSTWQRCLLLQWFRAVLLKTNCEWNCDVDVWLKSKNLIALRSWMNLSDPWMNHLFCIISVALCGLAGVTFLLGVMWSDNSRNVWAVAFPCFNAGQGWSGAVDDLIWAIQPT